MASNTENAARYIELLASSFLEINIAVIVLFLAPQIMRNVSRTGDEQYGIKPTTLGLCHLGEKERATFNSDMGIFAEAVK